MSGSIGYPFYGRFRRDARLILVTSLVTGAAVSLWWIDFNLYGHQIVAHLHEHMERAVATTNPVDGEDVPVPHFGVVMDMDGWTALRGRLEAEPATRWVIHPGIRFEGLPGEQATMFVLDPFGNALEFKAFKDLGQLFAK